MSEHSVTLSTEQDTALTQMGISDLEAYVKAICDAQISKKLNDDWTLLSDADKKTALGQ